MTVCLFNVLLLQVIFQFFMENLGGSLRELVKPYVLEVSDDIEGGLKRMDANQDERVRN